jgi:hypothetical protein
MTTTRTVFLILIALTSAMFSGASWAQSKLEASIFSYDGKDFVRTNTTLTDKGKSATGTKLDQSSAGYKALVAKQSYTGPVRCLAKITTAATHRSPMRAVS